MEINFKLSMCNNKLQGRCISQFRYLDESEINFNITYMSFEIRVTYASHMIEH